MDEGRIFQNSMILIFLELIILVGLIYLDLREGLFLLTFLVLYTKISKEGGFHFFRMSFLFLFHEMKNKGRIKIKNGGLLFLVSVNYIDFN